MTTEEKKCVNCGATWGQIFNNPHECSGGELPLKSHKFAPPQTGREWDGKKSLTYDKKKKRWILTNDQLGHLMEHVETHALAEREAEIIKSMDEYHAKYQCTGCDEGVKCDFEDIKEILFPKENL